MSKIDLPIQIDTDALLRAFVDTMASNRVVRMTQTLGEACSKTDAAKAIGCSTQTITAMLEDGRLESACEGTRVDVQSLARYIERRTDENRKARLRRKGLKNYV